MPGQKFVTLNLNRSELNPTNIYKKLYSHEFCFVITQNSSNIYLRLPRWLLQLTIKICPAYMGSMLSRTNFNRPSRLSSIFFYRDHHISLQTFQIFRNRLKLKFSLCFLRNMCQGDWKTSFVLVKACAVRFKRTSQGTTQCYRNVN